MATAYSIIAYCLLFRWMLLFFRLVLLFSVLYCTVTAVTLTLHLLHHWQCFGENWKPIMSAVISGHY